MLESRTYKQLFLVHSLVPSGPIPTAQDPDGVYPYESYCETAKRPELVQYNCISIKNDHISVTICPDLGGKVLSLIHNKSGKEALYSAPIVRPVRILPRQFYIGGGIEVSFPISHTPVQINSVHHSVEQRNGRIYVWCGEKELRFGMNWTVEYSLGEGEPYLTQRTRFLNQTTKSHPWMSWSNAGVPCDEDTQFHFPSGPVLYHGNVMKKIDWDTEGPKKQGDISNMAGFFWRQPDCNAFGVYTPSLGCGLYHIADPKLTPGIKLWSDGVNEHTDFVTQWTLNSTQCLEIQAGPIVDQSIKEELKPGEEQYHIEFWIPTDCPMDIRKLTLPNPQLIERNIMPIFDYARNDEVHIWKELIFAHKNNNKAGIPIILDITNNHWAPSGIEELETAIKWAVSVSEGDTRSGWLFQLGTWFAGNDRNDEAITQLQMSKDDRAKALSGRIYRRVKNDINKSAECFRSIVNDVFARHPQIVFERDITLALLGKDTLEERQFWIDETSALQDEWLIERRAALLIDKGDFIGAKRLLENTHFQLVHQRYARTKLWRNIEEHLGIPHVNKPNWLGEDNLAQFGAYREYKED